MYEFVCVRNRGTASPDNTVSVKRGVGILIHVY